MSDRDPKLSWQAALTLYDSLIDSGWEHISAFRALVGFIADSPEATGLTAITSHETLTISPYSVYPDWFEGRRVQLHPLADGRVRVDRYSETSHDTLTLTLEEVRAQVHIFLAEL
jgi:hypothetical protein